MAKPSPLLVSKVIQVEEKKMKMKKRWVNKGPRLSFQGNLLNGLKGDISGILRPFLWGSHHRSRFRRVDGFLFCLFNYFFKFDSPADLLISFINDLRWIFETIYRFFWLDCLSSS